MCSAATHSSKEHSVTVRSTTQLLVRPVHVSSAECVDEGTGFPWSLDRRVCTALMCYEADIWNKQCTVYKWPVCGGRAVQGVGLRQLGCWDRGFESC